MMCEEAGQDLFTSLRARCAESWVRFVDHDFVRQLASGTLPEACFRHFLVQDYVFLIHFSRAWALAVYKSERLEDMRSATQVLNGLLEHEMPLHTEYCRRWGIEPDALEQTPEARANMAYTRYVLERGLAGDVLDLLVALAPCVCGYAEIGRERLRDAATRLEGNLYRDWLDTYAGAEFQQLADAVRRQMDRLAVERVTEQRLPALERTFREATELEVGFWNMGLERTM